MAEKLYAAMQDYATTVIGTAIVYDSHAYPYFFEDTNGDGERNEGEPGFAPGRRACSRRPTTTSMC
jgi:hypothetical protein